MKRAVILAIAVMALMLTGCGHKQIFVHEGDEYKLTRLTSESLSNDVFYVKDGSSFYAVYLPEKARSSAFWIGRDITLIPDYYKNELLAYQSQASMIGSMTAQRYADSGYTLGVFGIKESNGYYCFDSKSNCIDGSSIATALKHGHSTTIRIETINGESPKNYKLTNAGTFADLELDQVLTFGLYEGTVYTEIDVKVDCHALIPFESINITDIELTKNGYISVKMPENARSGYYLIGGSKSGLFRYHDHEKGECSPEGDNLNISNYASTFDELAALYQQYSIIVKAKTYDVKFNITYSYPDESEVKCVLQDPNSNIYEMECMDGKASLSLTEAMEGKWVLNVYPKGAEIIDIDVVSTASERATIYDECFIEVPEAYNHCRFTVTYNGAGNIWGTVENTETGESKELVNDSKSHTLVCDWSYLTAGTYKARLYHYNDTVVLEGTVRSTETTQETDILLLEEIQEDNPED